MARVGPQRHRRERLYIYIYIYIYSIYIQVCIKVAFVTNLISAGTPRLRNRTDSEHLVVNRIGRKWKIRNDMKKISPVSSDVEIRDA